MYICILIKGELMLGILRFFFEGRSHAVRELGQRVNSSVTLDFIKRYMK